MKFVFEKSQFSRLSIEIAMSKAQILRRQLLTIGYSSDELTYSDELFVKVYFEDDNQKNEIINLGKDNATLWHEMVAHYKLLVDGNVIFKIKY